MDGIGRRTWWVRHAPTRDGAGRIVGWTDIGADLTDGDAVAATASKLPEDADWFCSSLARARETTIALRECCSTAAPMVASDLIREQNFGAWEGKSWDKIDANGFWDDPANNAAPGGESFADVVRRTEDFLDQLRSEDRQAPTIVVAHAGPIRAAAGLSKGLPAEAMLELPVDYLSVTEVML